MFYVGQGDGFCASFRKRKKRERGRKEGSEVMERG